MDGFDPIQQMLVSLGPADSGAGAANRSSHSGTPSDNDTSFGDQEFSELVEGLLAKWLKVSI